MAVGKIASSTANYSTLGKTSPKNAENGFYADPGQFEECEVFAPSLNLGVSVINTVAPATQGYRSYTEGPGIEGGVGYAPSFTENNITIVKPDSLPTNPAFEDGRSFGRYETNFLEMARGLSSSVIIGGDLFTVQDYYQGGLNTPGTDFTVLGEDNNIIGMSNFRGSTATSKGYPTTQFDYNTILGSENFNIALRDDGNFAYIYPDYGYTLGYDRSFDSTIVVGGNNGNSLIPGGYYESNFSRQVIIGNDNFSYRRRENTKNFFEDPFGQGYMLPKIILKRTITIGNSNWNQFKMRNANGFDGGQANGPTISSTNNIEIGNNSMSNLAMTNHVPAGGTFSNPNINMNQNINIGDDVNLRQRAEISPSSASGYGASAFNINIGSQTKSDNANYNVLIGDRIAAGNESRSFDNANGWSNLYKNTIVGDRAMINHGVNGAETNTNYNTIIGADAQSLSTGLNNCTVIGYDAEASTTNASNEITLGNSSISALRCNVTSITSLSDARDKTNIEPISNASAFIKDLKPVKFDWNRRDGVKAKEHDIGFLAQDLDEAQSKHGIQEHLDIVYKSNPEALEASYGKLLPILVQALKEQQEEIEKLKSTN